MLRVHAPCLNDTGHVVVTVHHATPTTRWVKKAHPMSHSSALTTAARGGIGRTSVRWSMHAMHRVARRVHAAHYPICCCTHAMADNPRGRFKAPRLRGHAFQISTNVARSRHERSTMHGAHQYYVVRNNCCFLTLSAVTRPATAAGGRGGRKRTRDRRRHPRRCARRVPHGPCFAT